MQSSVYVETATPRTKDRGADLFVALLRAQGVQQVMALTGGAIMEGMDALQAAEHLDMTIFQTEPGAAWAAMGYARTTGRVGVCVVTSGPGATNTITAIADAQRDNVPLIIITGQVPTAARNTDAFQETNIVEIAAPTAKKVFYLNRVEDMPAVVSEAFRSAIQGRPGPVLIDLTKDAQQAPVHARAFPTVDVSELTVPSAPAHAPVDAALDAVVALLRQAERPVIIAGYGILLAHAQRELQQLLQVVPCPVVHTLPGKAALPTAHPCNYGMLGMHGFYVSNWIVHHADLVLSLGSRYDDRITGDPQRFAPAARRLVHFDIDPEQIAKVLPGRKLGVVGDLKATLVALQRRLDSAPLAIPRWRHAITKIGQQYPSTYVRRPEWLQAQYALAVLNDVVQQQVIHTGQQVTYTTEVGMAGSSSLPVVRALWALACRWPLARNWRIPPLWLFVWLAMAACAFPKPSWKPSGSTTFPSKRWCSITMAMVLCACGIIAFMRGEKRGSSNATKTGRSWPVVTVLTPIVWTASPSRLT
jgi:acetolactate synthase-1/2/3 large subunit